jgi:hypothetical protein
MKTSTYTNRVLYIIIVLSISIGFCIGLLWGELS